MLRRTARGAAALLGLWLAVPVAAQTPVTIAEAQYAEPTTRYAHGVLGDAVEWGALRLRVTPCTDCAARDIVIRLPQSRVFEDIAPRPVALNGGAPDAVIVVESNLSRGARLALYTGEGLLAATPFIGRANRWLAPAGAADLDGDGRIELAYVDRPHLAKTLRIVRYIPGSDRLEPVASASGLTNHRIGWDYIAGGLRDCGSGPDLVLADAGWTRVVSARLSRGKVSTTDLAPWSDSALRQAMACR